MPSPEALAKLNLLGRRRVLDRAAVEICQAFKEAGIDSILLKGPATARILYPGSQRFYTDVDILVSPTQFGAAAEVARQLGFDQNDGASGVFGQWVSRALETQSRTVFRTSDSVSLDLHRSFHLVPRHSDLMALLWSHSEWVSLDGTGVSVRVPDAAGVGLMATLHAKSSGHGPRGERLGLDVVRSLEQLPSDEWGAIAAMARYLGVERSAATVLRERGGPLAERVIADFFDGVRPDRWLRAYLRTGSVVAFQVLKLRPCPISVRLVWLLLPLAPRFRPGATIAAQSGQDSRLARLRWLAADVSALTRVMVKGDRQ
jgi:hypothetical protein